MIISWYISTKTEKDNKIVFYDFVSTSWDQRSFLFHQKPIYDVLEEYNWSAGNSCDWRLLYLSTCRTSCRAKSCSWIEDC